jgi:hypothetical protein
MHLTGQREGCPACRTALAGLHSEAIAEEQCPRCEADLWALALPSGPVFFIRRPGQTAAEFIDALAGPGLCLSDPDIVSSLQSADSLDLVELMVEFETAWERRNGWPDKPMYDPQLDERLCPKIPKEANGESRC